MIYGVDQKDIRDFVFQQNVSANFRGPIENIEKRLYIYIHIQVGTKYSEEGDRIKVVWTKVVPDKSSVDKSSADKSSADKSSADKSSSDKSSAGQ